MHESESMLIEHCKKGHQKAQMQIYDRYSRAMYTIACRYLKNTEDAKDAMQEGFLKAFTKIEHYTPVYPFGTWLKRIIINQCLDVLKQRHLKYSELDEGDVYVIDDDNWDFDATITKTEILEAIARLTPKYNIVVTLYLIEGYDHEEISRILGIPEKTSRTHLRRGKLKLRTLLKKQYNETRY